MASIWAVLASLVSKLFRGGVNIGKDNQSISVDGDGSAVATTGGTVHIGDNVNNPPPAEASPGRIEINTIPDADCHNWYAVRDSREDDKAATYVHCVFRLFNTGAQPCSVVETRVAIQSPDGEWHSLRIQGKRTSVAVKNLNGGRFSVSFKTELKDAKRLDTGGTKVSVHPEEPEDVELYAVDAFDFEHGYEPMTVQVRCIDNRDQETVWTTQARNIEK